MKFTKIICIFFAVLFIVTAASGAVARQETRSSKIFNIFRQSLFRSEGRLDGERPLASIISRLLDLFRFPSIERDKIVNVEDPEEETEPEEEEPVEEKGVVKGNVSVVLEDSVVFLSDACVDFYLPSDLNNAVYTARSVDDGSYCMSDVDEGVYIVIASKEGYESKTCEVNIDSGIVEFLDFVLSEEEPVELDLDFGIRDVQVDEQTYGNSVSVEFILKNNGEESLTLSSLELGGSMSVKITKPDSEVLWYGTQGASSSSSSRVLGPSETHTKIVEIEDEGDAISRKGIYKIQGFYKSTEDLDINLISAESQFKIKTDKYAVDKINDFSLRLFKDLLSGEDFETTGVRSFVAETSFSPALLWLNLHMLQQGAAGYTYNELNDVLGIDVNDESYIASIKNIYEKYLHNQTSNNGVKINNAIWFDESLRDNISQSYLDTLKEEYNYDICGPSSNGNSKEWASIYHWVVDTTEGILPKIGFRCNANNRIFIGSTLYLNEEWETPFDSTVSKSFYYEDGQVFVTDISFMTGTFENLNYEETEDLQILDLPFSGDISILMMLPKQGYGLGNIAKYMSKETFADWQESFSKNKWSDSIFNIYIPITKLKRGVISGESGIREEAIIKNVMAENLKNMGINQAFSKQYADFSKIISSTSQDDNPYLKNVYQESFIQIDENGIEAAAYTKPTITKESSSASENEIPDQEKIIPRRLDNEYDANSAGDQNENAYKQDSPDTIIFDADHPFSFIIHDKKGTILHMGNAYGKTIITPLVLDLNSDGIKTSEVSDGALFDLNNDGKKDLTGWIAGKDDAFLALNLNHNGIIDNGGELFGDNTLLPDGEKASNGFEALAQYDKNKDQKIDNHDEIWFDLILWIDTDHNGISEQNELTHIKDSQVEEIHLEYNYLNKVDHGNLLRECSSFKNKDGSTGSIIDVWFKVIT